MPYVIYTMCSHPHTGIYKVLCAWLVNQNDFADQLPDSDVLWTLAIQLAFTKGKGTLTLEHLIQIQILLDSMGVSKYLF